MVSLTSRERTCISIAGKFNTCLAESKYKHVIVPRVKIVERERECLTLIGPCKMSAYKMNGFWPDALLA